MIGYFIINLNFDRFIRLENEFKVHLLGHNYHRNCLTQNHQRFLIYYFFAFVKH
jgi:hypothetical protein